jgi:hypothetical protein
MEMRADRHGKTLWVYQPAGHCRSQCTNIIDTSAYQNNYGIELSMSVAQVTIYHNPYFHFNRSSGVTLCPLSPNVFADFPNLNEL